MKFQPVRFLQLAVSAAVSTWSAGRNRFPLVVAAIMGPVALAQAATTPGEPEQRPPNRLDFITNMEHWEQRHRLLSTGVAETVERIDRLFGDSRIDDDTRDTRLRVRLGFRYSDVERLSLITQVRARVSLPQIERRLQLIIDDDVEADDVRSGRNVSDAFSDTRPDAALRFLFGEGAHHRTSVDAGVRLSSPRQGFLRWRGWLTVPVPDWELRFIQTAAWYTATGFAETTEMRWTRPLTQLWWFRSRSLLTWEEEISGVTAHQSLILGRELSHRRGFLWEVGGIWPELPTPAETMYYAEFTYRQRLHKDWLFLEVAPGVDFRRSRDYKANPGIAVRLETIFGDPWRAERRNAQSK